MGIARIVIVPCAGGEIPDIMRAMAEIAEKYKCEVFADLNGTPVTVGPDRVRDIHDLWLLRSGITGVTPQEEPLCGVCRSPRQAPIHAGPNRQFYWHHDFADPKKVGDDFLKSGDDVGLMPGRRDG